MVTETERILSRLVSLKDPDELRRVSQFSRGLWLVGLALCVFVVFGLIYKLHPALVSVASVAMGWVIAERNALRTRVDQWPIFARYIDWQRVKDDLGHK